MADKLCETAWTGVRFGLGFGLGLGIGLGFGFGFGFGFRSGLGIGLGLGLGSHQGFCRRCTRTATAPWVKCTLEQLLPVMRGAVGPCDQKAVKQSIDARCSLRRRGGLGQSERRFHPLAGRNRHDVASREEANDVLRDKASPGFDNAQRERHALRMIVREMYADRPRLAVERRQPDGPGRVGLLRRGPSAISLGQLDPNDDHLVWMEMPCSYLRDGCCSYLRQRNENCGPKLLRIRLISRYRGILVYS